MIVVWPTAARDTMYAFDTSSYARRL